MNDTTLTRRDFIKSGLLAGVSSVAELSGLDAFLRNLDETSKKPPATDTIEKKVTFQEALTNPNDQETVTKLIRQSFESRFPDGGEFINGIKYVKDTSSVRHEIATPKIGQEQGPVEIYTQHIMMGDKVPIATIIIPVPVGMEAKSDIYFYGRILNNFSVNTNVGLIVFPATLSRIESILGNFYQQAADSYDGIKLDKVPQINSFNFGNINSNVISFVLHSRGIRKQIEVSKAIENPNVGYVHRNQYGKLPPAYSFALTFFENYLLGVESLLKPNAISFNESLYVMNELSEFAAKVPELAVSHTLQRLFKAYGHALSAPPVRKDRNL